MRAEVAWNVLVHPETTLLLGVVFVFQLGYYIAPLWQTWQDRERPENLDLILDQPGVREVLDDIERRLA